MQSFDDFFVDRLNRLSDKQSRLLRFETHSPTDLSKDRSDKINTENTIIMEIP